MTEHPIFVPTDDGHVAAVITMPDGEPRGDRPPPRRHGTAQRDRLDPLGEPLGGARRPRARVRPARLRGRRRQSRTGRSLEPERQLGGDRAGARRAGVARGRSESSASPSVGTCYGSRVALSLVEDPGCIGAVCLAPPILDFGGMASAGRSLRDRRIAARVLSSPTLRRVVVQPLRPLLRARKPAPRVVGALAHLDRARVSFLYGERNPQEDHYSRRALQTVESTVAGLPPAAARAVRAGAAPRRPADDVRRPAAAASRTRSSRPSSPRDGAVRRLMPRDLVPLRREAKAANAAFRLLDETQVEEALLGAAARLRERPDDVLDANADDVERSRGRLDAGSLDRLVSTPSGSSGSRASSRRRRSCRRSTAMSASGRSTTASGVTERRIPIGTIGANFEARPNVAADIASQVLKSGNTVVMRTGSARARHRDRARRLGPPARARSGRDPRGRGRARPLGRPRRRGGARLVPAADPARDPARQRPFDRHLARRAAEHGVRTLAHAEGGGVLYAHAAADRGDAARARAREPRPARRLQPPQPRARRRRAAAARRRSCARPAPSAASRCAAARGRLRPRALEPIDGPLGHEWASDEDPERVATVTRRARRRPRRGTPDRERARRRGSRPRSSPTDDARRRALPRRLPRHGGVLERADAVHRRLRAARHARDGHQRRLDARPARPRHLPRSLAAAVPRRRRRHAGSMTRRRQVRLDARRDAAGAGPPAAARRARAAEIARARGRRRARLRRLVGRDRARAAADRSTPAARTRRPCSRLPPRSASR